MASYLRPERLDEALAALASGERVVVAGATDYYPSRVAKPWTEDILDVSGLGELGPILPMQDGWWFPATATWTDVIEAPLPPLFEGLKAAARTIGGIQIQNRGTLCGNVANASPAADGMPCLMALGAEVELTSRSGRRRLPVARFVTGNRSTLRRTDELITGIHVPSPPGEVRSGFLKLGSRSSLVISIVMVAGVIVIDPSGHIETARLAVGACSPVARRLPALETRLLGERPARGLSGLVESANLAPLSPIDDVRGTAEYRLDAALTLVRRLVEDLCA